jgi:hypothetical protein
LNEDLGALYRWFEEQWELTYAVLQQQWQDQVDQLRELSIV